MNTVDNRPKFLTKNAIKTIIEAEDVSEVQDLKPVLQILTVKDVRSKKNMKDKLTVSDGVHKMLCIIKEKINTTAEGSYKALDVIRLNNFAIKNVSNVKVIIPSNDFEIISNDIEESIGKPKDYKEDSEDDLMDIEFEIPYKTEEKEETIKTEKPQPKEESIEGSDESDVEMKESSEKKQELEKEVPPSPSPVKYNPADDEDDIYTPIKALSPMNSDWIIKARVSRKYPVKEWSNAKGQGKLLNFELVDKYGTQIQATLFNKAVDKFESMLQQDKVYIFSKGTVKCANQKFTAIKNDYSLTFSPFSDISLTEDDQSISKAVFNFTTLSEVQTTREGKTLDFIGVIVSVSDVSSISLKTGGTRDKRDYELIDNSVDGGLKSTVTLWGSAATKYNFPVGTVVAFKGLKITNFRGISLNGGDYAGVFDATKAGIKEAKGLAAWFRTVKGNLDSIKSLSEPEEGEKKSSTSMVRLISEINESVEQDLVNDPQTRYYINAHVEMIKNDPKMVYMACPSCKKKMTEEDSGYSAWRCERCEITTATPVPTYILSVKFTDASGSLWARVHGDSALPIMKNMTPEKFKMYLDLGDESREQEVKEQLNQLCFNSFSILIKPSVSDYNGQQSLGFFASRVYDFSFKKNNDFAIQRLKAYQKLITEAGDDL